LALGGFCLIGSCWWGRGGDAPEHEPHLILWTGVRRTPDPAIWAGVEPRNRGKRFLTRY